MSLSRSIASGETLVGTFIKTPHPMVIEALGGGGLDFIILDAEHSTFGIAELDRCVLAARYAGLPVLVRLTEGRPADILRVLDMGAEGFLVPHVTTAAQAEAIVTAARYGAGGRGYSATNRAGQFGRTAMKDHLANASDIAVVVQIEDPEGVDAADAIAAVPGIASCFIGRADLAVAYGVNDLDAAETDAAVAKVIDACARHGVAASTFVPDMKDVGSWLARGVKVIAVASEHKPMQDYFSSAAVASAKG